MRKLKKKLRALVSPWFLFFKECFAHWFGDGSAGENGIMVMRVFKLLLSNKPALFAAAILAVYLAAGIAGECYSFYCRVTGATPVFKQGDMNDAYAPPSREHVLGTDFRGRDVFWKAFFGVRTALKVGLVGSLFAAFIGTILGVAAGYFGGRIDDFVVWLYSVFASIPTLLFILAFALLLRKGFLTPSLARAFNSVSSGLNTDPGMLALYLGIGLTGWVSLCRVSRSETMRLRGRAYVQAARNLGFSDPRIILRHILPNLFHIVIIYFTMRFAYAVMTEVIVSYLGMGVQLEPSWGVMIADGQQRLWRGVWWEIAAATGFMFFLVLSLHVLGDFLRDVLDPRLRV
jgi:peptide/nickel transport system permease protein